MRVTLCPLASPAERMRSPSEFWLAAFPSNPRQPSFGSARRAYRGSKSSNTELGTLLQPSYSPTARRNQVRKSSAAASSFRRPPLPPFDTPVGFCSP